MPKQQSVEQQQSMDAVEGLDQASETESKAVAADMSAAKKNLNKAGEQLSNQPANNQDLDLIFGEVVSILMRDPLYRHCSLADLEWMVIPALLTRQFQMIRGQTKETSEDKEPKTYPLGVVLWANVSEEVDAKLEAQKKAGLSIAKLAPQDWRSGEITWLVTLVAQRNIRTSVLEKVRDKFEKYFM